MNNKENKATTADVCYGNGTIDIKTPVMALDIFCKTWCIDRTVKDRLAFNCIRCEFLHTDGSCAVKGFKRNKLPQYKEFGSMGDL